MNENELYEEYDGICVPEDEYLYLVENEFINGDLQDMFVGSFNASKDELCQKDNELVSKIDEYLLESKAIFIQDTRAKGVLEESRAFFFFNEFLVVVPINPIQEVTQCDENTVKIRYTKSQKKPVCIPLKNIKEIYHPIIDDEKRSCSMLILYRNGERKSDVLFLGGDAHQYSDAIYEYKDYPKLIEDLNSRLDNAIDFMLMEDMLLNSFDGISKGKFVYIKYNVLSPGDELIINTIRDLEEHIKPESELLNIISVYDELVECYFMHRDKYEKAKRKYERAPSIIKSFLRKDLERKKLYMNYMSTKADLEAFHVIDNIKEWVGNTSKKIKNKEVSSNS